MVFDDEIKQVPKLTAVQRKIASSSNTNCKEGNSEQASCMEKDNTCRVQSSTENNYAGKKINDQSENTDDAKNLQASGMVCSYSSFPDGSDF